MKAEENKKTKDRTQEDRTQENRIQENRTQKDKILEQEARELTAKLTLEEKIGMIHGAQLFRTKGVERLGIPPLVMSDGPMGVRQDFYPASWKAVGHTDDYVSYLPCNTALAATWNRELARKTGSVLGEESRGRGKDVILAPGINLKRSPLCGRNFEYFSEDPYLTKELASPFIQGIQQWDVAACVKHFAANNQETERLWVDVKVDEEALKTLYLPAFYEALVHAGSYTVMGAYNKLNGEHCCYSNYLLDQVLREEWGYNGVVISDWGGVHDTEAAAKTSLDIEMSVTYDFDEYCMANPLKKKILSGEIPESAVDEKVVRILMLMMRLHMLDGKRKSGTYNTPEHQKTALEAARESVVLLKNNRKLLPLSPEDHSRILVIGENGNTLHANGGGSAEIKALYEISPLMGIKKFLGGNTEVDFVPGYCRDEEEDAGKENETNWQEASLENGGGAVHANKETSEKATGLAQDDVSMAEDKGLQEEKQISLAQKRKALREEAVALAKSYVRVIFIGGLNHEQDCEGNDRADMKLPYEQDVLIAELLAVKPDMVVVLLGGSPVEMGRWIHQAEALVWGWYGGMEGGTALAEVLFGQVNPSGKLPESFYKTHMDCSAHAVGEFADTKEVHYQEGLFVGYRYLDAYKIEPEFCFGHGLSYTSFSYTEGRLRREGGKTFVSCLLTNAGDCEGAEVVQLYLRPGKQTDGKQAEGEKTGERKTDERKLNEAPSIFQELKGFEKVNLKPGESRMVSFCLDEESEGKEIALGSSSRDIRIICK